MGRYSEVTVLKKKKKKAIPTDSEDGIASVEATGLGDR